MRAIPGKGSFASIWNLNMSWLTATRRIREWERRKNWNVHWKMSPRKWLKFDTDEVKKGKK